MSRPENIIMIPYAEKKGANSGVNISNNNSRKEIYLKNCCVALFSAKYHNPDCDVALVTNTDIPESYRSLLDKNGVMIFHEEFDEFVFPNDYTWSLAFYKLCALKKVVNKNLYKRYAYLDADVYIQSSFTFIWKECDSHVMMYDIDHGLQVKEYHAIVKEFHEFTKTGGLPTHYGGEFVAVNHELAIKFLDECDRIYRKMIDTSFVTLKGDEFIISLAADELKGLVKNAGAYIYRFWTGQFRLISTCYRFNPVTVIHVPNEKEHGMVRLFDRYYLKGKKPSDKEVYKLLHLKRRRFKVWLKDMLKR